MPRAGRRYPLVIYQRMLNRWWPATLLLAIGLFLLGWGVSRWPEGQEDPLAVEGLYGLGAFALAITAFLFLIRKAAYVRPYKDHLRLVTPFLRLHISYRRFRGTTTTTMQALFPPSSISGWRREIIAPLASMTAVIIHLNAFPMPPAMLRLFLSPFFFKDKTPHFVILVEDWLRFSAELDSMRAGGGETKARPQDHSILSRLPHQ
ncbi:MAG: hypothetical protein Fur0043_08950 [Anaerolineales bacterium]